MKAHYERLSAVDAAFLEIEDANTHMHVAATLLLEPGPLATPEGGLDVERIRAYISSRLRHIPRYRQRLEYVPYEQHPVWVDDACFNIFYHVRHASLPRPGSERQLKRLCGRLLSQKLDATKPLWEVWVVEGLADGRFAVVAKVHHCMIDGIAGVDLLTALLSPTPEETFEPEHLWFPRPAPSQRALLAGELWRRAALPLDVARAAAHAVAEPVRTLSAAYDAAVSVGEVLGETMTDAAPTPLNPERIGPHRRFDWLRLDLNEVKAVKHRLGGTINDVVLATVVGGLRRFLHGRGVSLDYLDFRALIPVSVRGRDEHGATLGNRIAQMLAALPLDERDPRRRLARVIETTTRLKQSHQVEASELLGQLGDWSGSRLITQMMELGAQRRVFNVIVTNVPGPTMPLYLLGAPLREIYPTVPLFREQGLGIALFSYLDGLYWGLNADWDVLPDLHQLVDDLAAGFADLAGVS